MEEIRKFRSMIGRLIDPAGEMSQLDRRRIRVMTLMQLTLTVFLAMIIGIVIVFNLDDIFRMTLYLSVVSGLLGLLIIAIVLKRFGLYKLSAAITVACVFFGSWSPVLFDPAVRRTDFIPMVFLGAVVPVCALFLRTRVVLLVALIQFAGISVMLAVDPLLREINWPSLYSFIFIIAVVGIVSGVLEGRDLKRIDEQTRQLKENETTLREMILRDPLTGLHNRRYLDEALDREVSRSVRKGFPIGIIMFDVDNFKTINDTHGHVIGDALLRSVGELLQKHIRGADTVCRYGGDEFILVLPEAAKENTIERAEQIRKEIGANIFQFEDFTHGQITISGGVAVYPSDSKDVVSVIKMADEALYRAKRAGRDRIMTGETI